MTSLRNVAALILAITIVQLAGGMLGALIPLAMKADRLADVAIGALGAMYFIGFMAGAWFAPTLLARVGHIRVYAATGALAAVGVLGAYWADGPFGWALVRLAQGAALAFMFATVESWLNSSLKSSERGGVMGFYLVCTKLPLALGPFLFETYGAASPESFMIAAMCLALSLLPICFTRAAAPEPPKAQPLAIGAQYQAAPAAVTAAFAAGLTNSAILLFAPLYAQARFGDGQVAEFLAAAWIGSLIVQWPAGKLSDFVDRRLVIAMLSGTAAAAAAVLALTELPFQAAAGVFAIWGATGLSFYGLGVAHMADRSEPGQLARGTAGLLFVWAAGSLIGPTVAGALVEAFGPHAVFGFAAVMGGLLTAAMVWRRAKRAPTAPTQKAPFTNQPATSPAVAELALGERAKDGQSV